MVIDQARCICANFEAAKKTIKSSIGAKIKSILHDIKKSSDLVGTSEMEEAT
jgi:hypothetical protein